MLVPSIAAEKDGCSTTGLCNTLVDDGWVARGEMEVGVVDLCCASSGAFLRVVFDKDLVCGDAEEDAEMVREMQRFRME